MDTPLKIALNLLLLPVIFAAVHFTVRAFLRPKPDRTTPGSLRGKIFVFDLVLTLVAFAAVQLAIHGFLRSEPPENVSTLMTAMGTPSEVTVRDMEETICNDFRVRFGDLYGIELEQEEADRFAELVKATDHTFELRPFLMLVIRNECVRRKTPEKFFVHQSLMVQDPEEKERMKSEWITAAEELLMETAPYHAVMEPVFRDFYAWWTRRHPEYEGLTAPVSVEADHDGLVDQFAVSLRRSLLVRTAKQMENKFVEDLRKRGIVISEAKLRKAFLLFLDLSKERYTAEALRKTAAAIVDEVELTDKEILFCIILKTRPLTEERLMKIQEVQVRYLTPLTLNPIPEESVNAVRRELQELSGVAYGLQ